ncbi:hypothetical protein O0I10_012922 [Lichtheimia ornata]|uniref:Uncharacterized protein n=1 Tax=Lichtheimia ornata TaxID=688661 RepID=A0AAD7USL7_9FUNG|nr:uncharacterized protein O0I10_012922 [Lichtheimia ornata]KAJ8651521.1 hypothetical protein O0I10_012922 [Lichtheimia ornata]
MVLVRCSTWTHHTLLFLSQEGFRKHNRYGIWNTYCTHRRQVDQASNMGHCWTGIWENAIWVRSLTRSYFRGAAGALVVYDICNRETFLGVRSWLKDVRTLANPELVMILVGNKVDKADDEREVSYLEASRFAQENEMMFLEASALTGDAVEEMFFKCARSILSKIETGQIDPERSGSGVQFGDSSLRRMTQRTRTRRKERSSCCF